MPRAVSHRSFGLDNVVVLYLYLRREAQRILAPKSFIERRLKVNAQSASTAPSQINSASGYVPEEIQTVQRRFSNGW